MKARLVIVGLAASAVLGLAAGSAQGKGALPREDGQSASMYELCTQMHNSPAMKQMHERMSDLRGSGAGIMGSGTGMMGW